jgi:DNA-binding MarR family transcriptional regulator
VLRPLERELEAQCGLALSWYDVLVQLNEAPDKRLRMQRLAQAVLLSKSRITRLVDAMAAAGLLRKEPCVDDRRGVEVVLTSEGHERLRAAAPVHLRGIAEHFSAHLTGEEATSLQSALARVAKAN